jgi:hypothetical protein
MTRRGTVVADRRAQLVEMFEVMAELEAMCGRLASRRMVPAEHERLVESLAACERARKAMDTDWYYYENQLFHLQIYAGSHNGFLRDQASALHRRLSPYRRLQLRVRDRMPTSFSEHQGIVEAILAGQPELTAQRLRAHPVQGRPLPASCSLAGLRTARPGARPWPAEALRNRLGRRLEAMNNHPEPSKGIPTGCRHCWTSPSRSGRGYRPTRPQRRREVHPDADPGDPPGS